MGTLAWLGEAIRPVPVDKIHFGRPAKEARPRIVVFVRAAIAFGLLYLVVRYIALDEFNSWVEYSPFVLVGTLVCGFFVHPRAESSNLRWLGDVG